MINLGNGFQPSREGNLLTDTELVEMEGRAKLLPGLRSTGDIKRLIAEVRRLRHMVQNQEDDMTNREMTLKSVQAERDEYKRQKEKMQEDMTRFLDFPPEIVAKIKEHKLAYGKAMIKMTWTARYNTVEYSMIDPEGA